MRSSNELIASNVTSSGTSNSNVCLSEQWIRASFQVSCGSGSLTGVFTVQGSNDVAVGVPPNQFLPTNWNTLGSVTCSISVGSSVWIPFNGPQGTINYFETCAKYHRVQFVSNNLPNGWYTIRTEIRAL